MSQSLVDELKKHRDSDNQLMINKTLKAAH